MSRMPWSWPAYESTTIVNFKLWPKRMNGGHYKLDMCYLGIRPSNNFSSQKASLFNEGVDSILEIPKIYVCVSLDYNFYK